MNPYQELYQKKKMTAEQALELIKDGDYMFSAQAAAEPQAILSKLQHLKKTGVKGTTLNTCLPIQYYDAMKDPEMRGIMDHSGWFFNAGLRDAQKKKLVSAVPQSSTSILRKTLQRIRHDGRRPVVMATVSPMDEHGYLSLSISAIYERDLINEGALVLLEVNPNFPRTFGDTQVHISEVDALVESDRPIPVAKLVPYTEVDQKIGAYVASLVEDGSTIQLGIGNIPNAVANELKSKKHLGIHTEMFTETMVDLIECGAVDNSQKGFMNGYSVCSFTMGSQRLYDYVNNDTADHSIRPNMMIACGLDYTMLNEEQTVAVVLTVRQHLLTPRGLRTLSPRNPLYDSTADDSQHSQDLARMNGGVWVWPLIFYVRNGFQMMGDATRPTVPPAANLRNPRLSMISSLLPYLWQVKQALLALVLPMAICSAWQRSHPHISMVFSE